MTESEIDAAGYEGGIRTDLAAAITRAWERIAAPGVWWTGAERLAIAAETRAVLDCPTCRAQRAALSPTMVSDAHVAVTVLPDAAVEAIHRIRSDSGRLTQAWYQQITSGVVSDGHYVELVGIVATVIGLDTHDHALGLPLERLPSATEGEPSKHRPRAARKQIAWVPTLSFADVSPQDPDPYPGKQPEHAFHIHQALSLVPEAAAGFFDLDEALYLPQAAIREFDADYRAISHAQMELLAARLSAINGCVY